jgi:hypothetical protein
MIKSVTAYLRASLELIGIGSSFSHFTILNYMPLLFSFIDRTYIWKSLIMDYNIKNKVSDALREKQFTKHIGINKNPTI